MSSPMMNRMFGFFSWAAAGATPATVAASAIGIAAASTRFDKAFIDGPPFSLDPLVHDKSVTTSCVATSLRGSPLPGCPIASTVHTLASGATRSGSFHWPRGIATLCEPLALFAEQFPSFADRSAAGFSATVSCAIAPVQANGTWMVVEASGGACAEARENFANIHLQDQDDRGRQGHRAHEQRHRAGGVAWCK